MKKTLPILFVISTAVITAASLTFATNGSFTQLKAADNSVSHTLTFNKSSITSSSVSGGGFTKVGTFSFSTTTSSGSTFEVTNATVKGDTVQFNSSYMVYVEDEDANGQLNMSFQFHGVLSAVSVKLNGDFIYSRDAWDKFNTNQLVFNGSQANNGDATINASENSLASFYISSIVVEYTCSY